MSTDQIGNVRTLNIVPPEGGFGNIDWEAQSINIGGTWASEFGNLTSLSITDMHVEDITPLRNLTENLTYLDLTNNKIYDITPLGESRFKNSLTYLDLSGNSISGLGALSRFSELTTLRLVNTGISSFGELFYPPSVDIEYDEETGEPKRMIDSETGEQLPLNINPETGEIVMPTNSKLAEALRVFDISDNENLSSDKKDDDKVQMCDGNLAAFKEYEEYLAIAELYVNNSNLNSDDLYCIAELRNLEKLNVSNNHIDDFSPIKNKTYTSLVAKTQTFIREAESLDYSPIPAIFAQAGEKNYFTGAPNTPNTAVSLNSLNLNNAQFNGAAVRFQNAAAASYYNETPQPATVMVPSGTGAFEDSKLEVYFTGQVVTFNDSNLCNAIYSQGENGSAFYDLNWNSSWSPDNPVVLTNACNTDKKQIAMVSGGSSQFLRLTLDSVNNGSVVDLTGLEEFGSLQVLSLKNNALTDLSKLSNTYSLQQLWLNDNNLGSDDWQVITENLTSLEILYLNNNNMNEISPSIGNLYNLGSLYLVNNGISDVSPLAYASSLTVLDLSENGGITDFSGMVQNDSACNPSILKLENAGVVALPSASIIENGFSNLTSLNLNGNQLSNETIANLAKAPRLDELYLNDNRISATAGFSGITSLKKLFLDNNQIADVSGLISLTKLAELHLNANRIDDMTGLNTLLALATLDVRNQVLSGTVSESEEAYNLPAVFSQAKTMTFPKVGGFESTGNYTVENGTINYDNMTATIIDHSKAMTITIPDGGLAGTELTVTYDDGSQEFHGTITNNTGGAATVSTTSATSFIVTSNKACVVLWTGDNRTTYNRLTSNPVTEDINAREFNLNQIGKTVEVIVFLAGDVNRDNNVNVVDARRIVNAILGSSLPNLEEKIADVDGNNSINVRDARAIINNILGTSTINW